MILMCAGLCLLYSLMRMLFSGIDKERAVLISGIAVLYPPWIFYMQMTMTEALLLFLYILICWLLIRFLENPRALTAVFLVLALVYIYSVSYTHLHNMNTSLIHDPFWPIRFCFSSAVSELCINTVFS